MIIAVIDNGTVIKFGEHNQVFPHISFPASGPDATFMSENSAYQVVESKAHDEKTQKLEFVSPYFENGVVYTVSVVSKTDEDINMEYQMAASAVRERRNELLTASDWTQVADAPVDKAVWAVYRQQLRDISLQSEFPFNVTYPTAPVDIVA